MRRAFYAFSAFIIISFLALGLVLNYLAHSYMLQTVDDKVVRDLEMLATITQGAIAHNDYERIEEQVWLWGEKDPDIIAVRVILDGDNPIVEFVRETKTSDILHREQTIASFTGRNITFEILYDLAEHKSAALRFTGAFIALSACLAVGFIFFLWLLLQRLAIAPLQQEISRRKQVEEVLRFERNKVVNILDSMDDGVYIVNRDYDIEYVNPVLREELGEEEGRKCYDFFHNRQEVCPWCKIPEVFAGNTVRWEWFSAKNQKIYDLIDTPLKNPEGRVILKLAISRDISVLKQTKTELEKHQKHLEILVKEQTATLEEKVAELERMNDVFVGREFRVKELRDRVNELEMKIEELAPGSNKHNVYPKRVTDE